ncbi:xylan glycosyltransferase MUCI21-like [Typha latifolia]|uniref:xylan glycosyltransferase MUCI21-like n=1 Tax=Typha latifolia TaxID=4733 RepID=UPI003C2EDB42
MAHNHGNQQIHHSHKAKEEIKKSKQTPLHLLLFFLVSFTLLFASRFLLISPTSLLAFFGDKDIKTYDAARTTTHSHPPCSSLPNYSICCERRNYHGDICFMLGDIRTHSPSSSVLLYPRTLNKSISITEERIRPYNRKWEGPIMDRIDELHLRIASKGDDSRQCEVRHDVPAIFFSAGGYTGNVFHDFNEGIIPLYITSHHFHRHVVLVVLNYRHWWFPKYREILAGLSGYPIIDFSTDTRTHCFRQATVGLRFHETLSINPSQLPDNKTMFDFRQMLAEAYEPRFKRERRDGPPKLVIISRKKTRAIENEEEVVRLAKEVGFDVEVVTPADTMPMKRMYALLSSCDVMMGVHGAAMTHFLFMRPGSKFIQIVPLGVEKVAWTCYGEPATKMGLKYEEYKILERESSLYQRYGEEDPVVNDPDSVRANKGWEVTKELYLKGQNVTLDAGRLRKTLARVFNRVALERREEKVDVV